MNEREKVSETVVYLCFCTQESASIHYGSGKNRLNRNSFIIIKKLSIFGEIAISR